MNYIEELSALINIRGFLITSSETLQIKMTREEVKTLQAKSSELDKVIMNKLLRLDLAEGAVAKRFTSTVDVERLAEIVAGPTPSPNVIVNTNGSVVFQPEDPIEAKALPKKPKPAVKRADSEKDTDSESE